MKPQKEEYLLVALIPKNNKFKKCFLAKTKIGNFTFIPYRSKHVKVFSCQKNINEYIDQNAVAILNCLKSLQAKDNRLYTVKVTYNYAFDIIL